MTKQLEELIGRSASSLAALAVWQDTNARPRGNSSNVFLAQAVAEVGPRLVAGWTGREPVDAAVHGLPVFPRDGLARSYHEPPPPPPTTLADWPRDSRRDYAAEKKAYDDQVANRDEYARQWDEREQRRIQPIVAEHQRRVESWERLAEAMRWIAEQGEEGRLVTRGRLITGGEYFDLPPSIWSIENLWQTRFNSCSVTYRNLSSYIFLTRESLDNCLAALPKRKAAPHPSSFAVADEPLVMEMRRLIESGEAPSRHNASLAVVDRAVGGGTTESKARRLAEAYKARFPAR